MGKRIAILQGHPDPAGRHFCHALAAAYATGAHGAGHEVQLLDLARMDFPLLRRQEDWTSAAVPEAIAEAQRIIAWAEHLVIVFPLWLGDMPALLKAFFEQALRPGFALEQAKPNRMAKKLLKGRSARLVVTMGMPAFFYRLYYRAHSVKSLERNILDFCGVSPVRTTLIGTVASKDEKAHAEWLEELTLLGRKAR
jgi:putative NADPH-quinone reductase